MNRPTDDELSALVRRAEEAARAFVRGDVDRYLELVHHAPGFTLLPPVGGPASAHDDRRSEVRSWDGTGFTEGDAQFECVETHAWGDTVVLVMIERQHGRPPGLADRDLSLRVTHVYRLVEEQWQLVHRHADPLVRKRGPQELAVLFE
jgi:ketosteroid isomerase-like protein